MLGLKMKGPSKMVAMDIKRQAVGHTPDMLDEELYSQLCAEACWANGALLEVAQIAEHGAYSVGFPNPGHKASQGQKRNEDMRIGIQLS